MTTALAVDNRWGNTKYLLGQIIPGKAPEYRAMSRSKSYSELICALGLEKVDGGKFVAMAADVDAALQIGAPKMTKAERKARNKAAMAETEEAKVAGEKQITQPSARKRTADEAGLEDNDNMPMDVARQGGPGSLPEQASALAV